MSCGAGRAEAGELRRQMEAAQLAQAETEAEAEDLRQATIVRQGRGLVARLPLPSHPYAVRPAFRRPQAGAGHVLGHSRSRATTCDAVDALCVHHHCPVTGA